MVDCITFAARVFRTLRENDPDSTGRIVKKGPHYWYQSRNLIVNPVDLSMTLGLPAYIGPIEGAPAAYRDPGIEDRTDTILKYHIDKAA